MASQAIKRIIKVKRQGMGGLYNKVYTPTRTCSTLYMLIGSSIHT
jgi:hypothetical protein